MTAITEVTAKLTFGWSSYFSKTDDIGNVLAEPIDTNPNIYINFPTTVSDVDNYPVNNLYVKRFQLSPASGIEDIDLTSIYNPANDAIGSTYKIRGMLFVNQNLALGDYVKVGGAGSNAFSGPWANSTSAQNTIGPGDAWQVSNKFAGFTVDATHKILRLEHAGSSSSLIEVDVYLLIYV